MLRYVKEGIKMHEVIVSMEELLKSTKMSSFFEAFESFGPRADLERKDEEVLSIGHEFFKVKLIDNKNVKVGNHEFGIPEETVNLLNQNDYYLVNLALTCRGGPLKITEMEVDINFKDNDDATNHSMDPIKEIDEKKKTRKWGLNPSLKIHEVLGASLGEIISNVTEYHVNIHRIIGYYELQHRAAWKLKATDINPELEGTARLIFILKQPKGTNTGIVVNLSGELNYRSFWQSFKAWITRSDKLKKGKISHGEEPTFMVPNE